MTQMLVTNVCNFIVIYCFTVKKPKTINTNVAPKLANEKRAMQITS